MSTHTYGGGVIIADGARAATGLTLAATPLAFGGLPVWVTATLVLACGLFLLCAAQAARRALSRISVSDDGVLISGPWAVTLLWADLRRLRLAYYSTRRDRSAGWLQLTLGDGRRRVVVDSRIDGFAVLADRAAQAAREQALSLDAASVMNFRSLGIAFDGKGRQERVGS